MKTHFLALACLCLPLAALAQAESPRGSVIIKRFDGDAINNWAQCGWQKLPVTAQNLVNLNAGVKPAPIDRGIPFSSPEANLLARLNSACGQLLAPADRNTISYGVLLAKRMALKEARPATPANKDQATKLFVCAQKVAGSYMITETELSKPKPKNKIAGTTVECYRLESDGSLTNA